MRTDALRLALLLLLLSPAPGRAQGYREYAPAEAEKPADRSNAKAKGRPEAALPARDACGLESLSALLAEIVPLAETRLHTPKLLWAEVGNRAREGGSLPAITRWTFQFADPESGDSLEYSHTSDMDSGYAVETVLPDGKSMRREYWNRKAGEKRWTRTQEDILANTPVLQRCRGITSRVLDSREVQAALRTLGHPFCRTAPKGVALKDGFSLRLFSDESEAACRKWRNHGLYTSDRSLPKAVAGRENVWHFEDGRSEALFLDGPTGKLLYRGR